MRKIAMRVLLGLNILIVACFLLLSGTLFFFSLSNSPSFFGYSVLLKNSPEESLIVYRDKSNAVVAGDTLILRPTGGEISLKSVHRIEGDTAYFSGSDGQEATIGLDSSECLGTVTFQSPFWGHALSVLLRPGNIILCYIAISGFFLLTLLILLLVYYLGGKNEAPVLENDEDVMLLKALLAPVPEEGVEASPSSRAQSLPFVQTPVSKPSGKITTEGYPAAESMEEDVKIYVPQKRPSTEPPCIPEEVLSEPEIVIHTHYDEAYDIYDVITPSIDDILNLSLIHIWPARRKHHVFYQRIQ